MAGKKPTKEEKRLATLAEKTEKLKKALVAQLRKTPIVQVACERLGVGRSTYYEWRRDDVIFGRAADRALEHGRFFVNDLAESKLIALIKDGHLPAISLWLRHNSPRYAVRGRNIFEHEVASERPSVEEFDAPIHALSMSLASSLLPPSDETVRELLREYEADPTPPADAAE